MKKLLGLFAVAAFLLTGCYPQAVVIWSHDAQHGAVLTKDKIYFCDTQGNLAAKSIEFSGQAAWSVNSNDLYYVTKQEVSTWKEAVKYIDAAKQAELIKQADENLAKLKPGDLKDDKNNPFAKFEPSDAILTLLYLRDNHAAELRKIMVTSKEDEKTYQDTLKIKATLYRLFVCRNCEWDKPQLILQTFREIGGELRPSPNDKAVALVFDTGKGLETFVCDMNGKLVQVAKITAMFPDWTPDGNSLVYSATGTAEESSGTIRSGGIYKLKIFDNNGKIMEKFPAENKLADVAFEEICMIRCMKNGWVLFSSRQVNLPARGSDSAEKRSVYAIIPELSSAVVNIIPPSVQDYIGTEEWYTFQLSPDQKRLAVIKGNDEVSIFTFESCKVEKFELKLTDMRDFRPTWKDNEHLCMLSSEKDSEGKLKIKVYLQSVKSRESKGFLGFGTTVSYPTKVISTTWPAAVKESIIEKFEKEEAKKAKAAATQPAEKK